MSVNTLTGKGGKVRYRSSFASTRTSLVKAKDNKREEEKVEPVVVPFQMEEVQEKQEDPDFDKEMDDLEREKLVQQE